MNQPQTNFLEEHLGCGRVLPEMPTGKFADWVSRNLRTVYRRTKRIYQIAPPPVTTDASGEASSSDAGPIPRGEMDPPLPPPRDAEPSITEATTAMEVDYDPTQTAQGIYPSFHPDVAQTLLSVSLKIAANCRAVEKSRAQYVFDFRWYMI